MFSFFFYDDFLKIVGIGLWPSKQSVFIKLYVSLKMIIFSLLSYRTTCDTQINVVNFITQIFSTLTNILPA